MKFMETSARTGYNIENVNIKNMSPINSIVARSGEDGMGEGVGKIDRNPCSRPYRCSLMLCGTWDMQS